MWIYVIHLLTVITEMQHSRHTARLLSSSCVIGPVKKHGMWSRRCSDCGRGWSEQCLVPHSAVRLKAECCRSGAWDRSISRRTGCYWKHSAWSTYRKKPSRLWWRSINLSSATVMKSLSSFHATTFRHFSRSVSVSPIPASQGEIRL